MKVALLGNMNNNHFTVARYLRDNNIDVNLLLFDNDYKHFHPSNDSFTKEYQKFCFNLNWGSGESFLRTSSQKIRNDLSEYDIIIGCGSSPAFCYKGNIKLNIFRPYGGDIYGMVKYKLLFKRNKSVKNLKLIKNRKKRSLTDDFSILQMMYFQRKGIKHVDIFNMPLTNHTYENQFKKHAKVVTRWKDYPPLVYSPEYTDNNINKQIEDLNGLIFLEKLEMKIN